MNQRNSTSPPPPGLIRPLAIVLMVLGAAGFWAAAVLFKEQVLCQFGSTLVVFIGLGLVLYARRQQRPEDGAPAARRARQAGQVRQRLAEQHNGVQGTHVQRPVPPLVDEVLPEPGYSGTNGLGGLAGEVLAVYERKGASVRVEASRPERSIVRATLPDGLRATVLVVDSQAEVDLPEARALFALVNEHSSARGYLVARGGFSERSRAWANTRGLKLLSAGELWMLAIG
jgi:hypothetical protein